MRSTGFNDSLCKINKRNEEKDLGVIFDAQSSLDIQIEGLIWKMKKIIVL